MPLAGDIIQGVRDNEGFDIDIYAAGGDRPVNVNRELPGDDYDIETRGHVSVTRWESRFTTLYPTFSAKIKNPDGGYRHGRTLLSTVRGT